MVDPVCDRDGNSYERAAIEAWIGARGTSPITRNPMSMDDIVPNRSLCNAIEEYLSSLTPEQRAELCPDTTAAVAAVTAAEPPFAQLPPLGLGMTYAIAESKFVMTTITSPEDVERVASDIVCVIDVSGSMGDRATTVGLEDSQLSLLDITKHAVKTIINTLQDGDRLAIVSFSDGATLVCDLTLMNEAGRRRVTTLVESLDSGGSTNLWDGLVKGLNVLKGRDAITVGGIPGTVRNGAVMLLTDGQPSIEPPRGHLPMLRRWRDQNDGRFPGIISTFGFGYNLDSRLLADIANEGGGMYAFIPDAGFVGTAFVHALANTLTTVSSDVTLKLEIENVAQQSLMGFPSGNNSAASWGFNVKIGSLRAGQPLHFIVKSDISSSLPIDACSGTLDYRPSNSVAMLSTSIDGPREAGTPSEEPEVMAQAFRLEFVLHVTAACAAGEDVLKSNGSLEQDATFNECQARLQRLSSEMKLWLETETQSAGVTTATAVEEEGPQAPAQVRVAALLADLDGQVKEALGKPAYFSKWGRHYLPSLVRAHQLQACNNFKDPGLQFYGGRLFRSIRDKADDIFSEMPAPTPSRPSYDSYGGGAPPRSMFARSSASSTMLAAASAPPMSMRSYNSRNTPCVHGDSLVAMADGSFKPASFVKAGDCVLTSSACNVNPSSCNSIDGRSGRFSVGRVVCVLETLCPSGVTELVTLPGGLRITPWHPVRRVTVNSNTKQEWEFPCNVTANNVNTSSSVQECRAVYSFLVTELLLGKCQIDDADRANGHGLNGPEPEGLGFAQAVIVDGWAVLTLAHGIECDPVASHPFFGTMRVVDSLKMCLGWRNGRVTFLPGCVIRSKETGLGCAFDQSLQVIMPPTDNADKTPKWPPESTGALTLAAI